jgi:hypothetical protein
VSWIPPPAPASRPTRTCSPSSCASFTRRATRSCLSCAICYAGGELPSEFGEYAGGKGRLKVFRTEAVRAGFKRAWAERDYRTIVQVAQRLPESVLQEDPGLLMYYDNALMRAEQEPVQGKLL